MSVGVKYTNDQRSAIDLLKESGLLIISDKGLFILVDEREGIIPKCSTTNKNGKRCDRRRCGTLKYCIQHSRMKCDEDDKDDGDDGDLKDLEKRLKQLNGGKVSDIGKRLSRLTCTK